MGFVTCLCAASSPSYFNRIMFFVWTGIKFVATESYGMV